MRRLDFWRSDWFLSVLVALVVLTLWDRNLVQSLERKAYDLGVQATSRTSSDKIAIIAIDKQGLDNIGRWRDNALPFSGLQPAVPIDELGAVVASIGHRS